MRLRCHLWGCCEDERFPCCYRCVAYVYDESDWIGYPQSWLAPLRNRLADLRQWGRRAWAPCCSCGKRLWPWSRRSHGDHCSEDCFSNWIPF